MTKKLDAPEADAVKVAERKPPRAALDWTGETALQIELNGDWERLRAATGNKSVLHGVVKQASAIGSKGKLADAETFDFVVGFMDAMEPRDAAEVLLLAQMATTHQTVMMITSRLNQAATLQLQDVLERALNKTARTYAAQMETLKRYRSKGQQTVRVERVTVQEGGQAIVGNVETGGRGDDEK